MYQLGGQSLTKNLYEVKGEFFKGERLYNIAHQDMLRAMKKDLNVLKVRVRALITLNTAGFPCENVERV